MTAPITPAQTRRTIAIDEWAGYALLAYLCPASWRPEVFVAGLAVHVLVTYGVSYPEHWRQLEREGAATPLRWLPRRWR